MENGKRGQEPGEESILNGADVNTPHFAGRCVEGIGDVSNVGIACALEVLFEPGAVVELRALKGKEIVSGYFDSHEALAREANKLDRRGYAVYMTLNKVNSALLSRAANRTKNYPKATTSDADVTRRRWLPLDFDPKRPSDLSATDEEKKIARRRAIEVREFLQEQGWPEPVLGDSGNGYHLLYRVDLPKDQESLEIVRAVLEALAFRFSDDQVDLDTSVHDAARIWKLYGTTARKGDDTAERPHRRSKLLKVPERVTSEVVDREKLKAIADAQPSIPHREEHLFRPGRNGHQKFDLASWIRDYNVPVKREGLWKGNGYKWVLEECPWNGHKDNAPFIVRHPSGWIAAGCHHNSCQGYRWQNLREHFDPDAYARNGKHSETAVAGDWETLPASLPHELPPVAPFDPEMLPGPLRAWVLDIAERMHVPLDYVAAGAVTVAASLVGRKIGIRPKRYDDWLVVPVIWAGIVGPPSTLKSPALAEITRPLDRLVAEALEAHAEATEEHEAEAAVVEATKAALKKEIGQAAKVHVETGDRSELDDLIARQRDAKPPKHATERRYKTSDPTVEKLAELLKDNPRGILVQRDELTGWLRSLDRQGREVDRAFYLEAWNGTNSYCVDRIGRGTLHVPALCVSILGGIQPGPLSSYVFEASRGGVGADGLLQRFQLLVWPDPPSGKWRNVDRYPDADAKNRAYAVYRALDELTPEEAGATAEEGEDIPAVRFSPDAQEIFDAWREELEAKLRDGDENSPALTSHLAKYRSLMPALALIFHLNAVAEGTGGEGSVGAEAAARAAAWCKYLETHAERLYASAENPVMESARALLKRIRKGDVKDGDTVRAVYRKQWNRLSSSEAVTSAVAILEDYGWLRAEEAGTGGRPTRYLRLHPSLKGEA